MTDPKVTLSFSSVVYLLDKSIDSMQGKSKLQCSDSASALLRVMQALPRIEWEDSDHYDEKLKTKRVFDRMFRELLDLEPADFAAWWKRRVDKMKAAQSSDQL